MEAEEFAKKLVHAVTQPEAPRIVRLGTGADVLPELAKLDGQQLDSIMISQYELDKLRER
jgi:hypothetical protein